jgi:peroxiredoxin (alkyl hydroperoxide reductase subunit C)
VIGISVDASERNRAWAEKLKLPFRLLSDVDPKGKVGRQFGVWEDTWQFDGRATFVIDRKLIVRFVDAQSLALDPSRALAAVKRLARPS